MTSMIQRPLLRDFALIALATVLGWWAHSVDATVRSVIARAQDTNIAVRFDGGSSLHGTVVLTAWTGQHSIQIALRSGERTA
jgi:hypothetical protein